MKDEARPHGWADTRHRFRTLQRRKRIAVWTVLVCLLGGDERSFAVFVLTGLVVLVGSITYLFLDSVALNRRLARELRSLSLEDEEALPTLAELLACKSPRVKAIALDHLYNLLRASRPETELQVPEIVCRELSDLLGVYSVIHPAWVHPVSRPDRRKTLGILQILEQYGGTETLPALRSAESEIDPSDTVLREAFRRTRTTVRRNQQRMMIPGNLLQPADAPSTSTLLRPAGSGCAEPAVHLLRPTYTPDSLIRKDTV